MADEQATVYHHIGLNDKPTQLIQHKPEQTGAQNGLLGLRSNKTTIFNRVEPDNRTTFQIFRF